MLEEKRVWIRPVMMPDWSMLLICEMGKTTYSEDGGVVGFDVIQVGEPIVISASDMIEKPWIKTAFYDNVAVIRPPNQFHKTLVGF